jgi:hypothetical protein
MNGTTSNTRLSLTRLILLPSFITLAITLLRLTGELLHWYPPLFNASPGGGGSPLGISWLPFIFGPYFAWKLCTAGAGPASTRKAIGVALAGLAVAVVGGVVGFAPQINIPGRIVTALVMVAIAAALQFVGWPALTKTLIAYGYAARVPVLIIMFFAIRGAWGTHYDGPPPGFPPETPFWPKFFQIGVLPQMVFWVAYTVLVGALFGAIVAAILPRRKPAAATA